uniref:Uncharacterized protein n=1 Tax=Tanacetum cinerariifolium TaxID=118510 RepID=A0A6L2K7D0_TANCI|nr:hypothetical protein [Tanacetum cinerariifolium]
MAFVSSPNSTNEVNTAFRVSTANTQGSPGSTQVSTASTPVSTANLSDATVYDFLANQPNGSQLKTGRKITINGSDTAGYDKSKSYMADDEVPTNMALMAFLDSETSNSVSEDISNEVKEYLDVPLVKELVLNDNLEKKIVFPTVAKLEFIRPKQ